MKTQRNILIAFILNLSFAIFEFFGGLLTNSVAIMSDAVHDLGDAASIGFSYFLERKSKKQPDKNYTYGYLRYSVFASFVTTVILAVGSILVVINAVRNIIEPKVIDYDKMIIFAIVGVAVNFLAAMFTHRGESLNQKAVNLHMLEDVLGWVVVLIGAVVMRFTDFALIDPIMSIGVALFILINAVKNMKKVLDLFLMKAPKSLSVDKIKESVSEIDGVLGVHHIHVFSMDTVSNYASMHIVTNSDPSHIKEEVRHILSELKISHVTLELESENEHCHFKKCEVNIDEHAHHHHHHH